MTKLTAIEICKAAEAAAPGRVTYDLVHGKTITITSPDGTERVRIGLTDDLDGSDCWLAVRETQQSDGSWYDHPSEPVDSLDDVRGYCA